VEEEGIVTSSQLGITSTGENREIDEGIRRQMCSNRPHDGGRCITGPGIGYLVCRYVQKLLLC